MMTDDEFIECARRLAARFSDQPLIEIRRALLVSESSVGGVAARCAKAEQLASALLSRRAADVDAQSQVHVVLVDDHGALTPMEPERHSSS